MIPSIGAAQILFTSVRFHDVPAYRLKHFFLPVGNGRNTSRQVRDDRSHLFRDATSICRAKGKRRSPPLRETINAVFFLWSQRSKYVSFIRTDSWGCAIVTQWSRCCPSVDGRARVRQRDILPHAVQGFTMGRRCVLFDTISLLGLIILRRDYVPFVLLFILSGFDG